MLRAVGLCLLMTLGLPAQIQLYLTRVAVNEAVIPTTPKLQGTVVDFPDIRENDMADLSFELRNPGGADTIITNLRVFPKTDVCGSGGGTAFILMTEISTPPGTLRANGTYGFQVRYLPPKPQCYEAYLAVAQQTYVLKGTAAGRTVMFEIDTLGQRQVIDGSTSDFGNVRLGEAYTKSYRVVNSTGSSVTIAPPVISGGSSAYSVVEAPDGTRTVPHNALYEFKVRFSPTRTGLIPASLSADGRVINLIGEGLPGVIPNFALQAPGSMLDSNSQAEVRIQLVSATTAEVNGSLELRFEKDIGDMPDDAAIRFIDSGTRTLAFRVEAGTTDAVFLPSGSGVARFQTGTSSGKIRLVGKLAQWEQSAHLEIRSDTPRWSDSSLQRASGSLTVQVTGYDNTRSASSIEFRFFDASNQAIGDAGGVQAAVGDLFSAFFRASDRGGQFTLRAQFPVDGDAIAIRRVEVILRNRLGASLVRVLE
ncbi:MAG: choice-of-anchor D domain-containing protein [Bryobacterales bacterium]|nr:choice-of-anchor D domain-containing protein [Bryobacterales bacterium]